MRTSAKHWLAWDQTNTMIYLGGQRGVFTKVVVGFQKFRYYCLTVSLILHFKLPGKRCCHLVSLGSDLRNQVICQVPFDLNTLSRTFCFKCFVKYILIELKYITWQYNPYTYCRTINKHIIINNVFKFYKITESYLIKSKDCWQKI